MRHIWVIEIKAFGKWKVTPYAFTTRDIARDRKQINFPKSSGWCRIRKYVPEGK